MINSEEFQNLKAVLEANKTRLMEQYHLNMIGIFGSYTRNEQKPESDIDVVVDFDESPGIRFIDLAGKLENLLGHKVDLVSRNGIKSKYWEVIRDDIIYV